MIQAAFIIGLTVVLAYSANQCTRLDVATGRRDSKSLADDYGSNRGWHWPWTPIIQACFVGIIACIFWAIAA
jgi:hypothetical protein